MDKYKMRQNDFILHQNLKKISKHCINNFKNHSDLTISQDIHIYIIVAFRFRYLSAHQAAHSSGVYSRSAACRSLCQASATEGGNSRSKYEFYEIENMKIRIL